MLTKLRPVIIIFFTALTVFSGIKALELKFAFDFEQFFPQGDKDLEFFKDFIKEFETDDNFLLIAVEHNPSVFDSAFLESFHQYCLSLRDMPYVRNVQSLTLARAPVKTPFGISTIPVIHRKNPSRYIEDSTNIMGDVRYVNNLINDRGNALVVFIKHRDTLDHEESLLLMNAVHSLNDITDFENIHMLGRADLQVELVRMQKEEVMMTALMSFVLVSIVLILLFRRIVVVLISLLSISMALIIFLGLMASLDKEFNLLSALYPVLLLIVGTSDVIHIKSKYIDELNKGMERFEAMKITIREIGLATLLTSLTTAIGFVTLLTSRVQPVREFGINSAIGVIIAYVVVILFTTSVLSYLPRKYFLSENGTNRFWDNVLDSTCQYVKNYPRKIFFSSLVILVILVGGIFLISTNYRIENTLPKGSRVKNDFIYFEKQFAGFRPYEYAIYALPPYKADGYAVMKEINKIENILQDEPNIRATTSMAAYYKGIEKMKGGNARSSYTFPMDSIAFERSKKLLERARLDREVVLFNKDKTKSRISSRVADIGADSIRALSARLESRILSEIDTSVISVRRTGTGVVVDKNAIYIRDNLIYGLGMAIVAVSLLMALLFVNLKMLLIAIVPNIFPLLLAGAIIGYAGIELEAGVSVVFAIVFGIAVDDTIHFLSKFKLSTLAGKTREEALETTMRETGKAIIYTTIILFFGFMIMIFSDHQPSVTIGLLIAGTLVGAVICDLTLLPALIRRYL